MRGRRSWPRTPTVGEVWRGLRPLQTSPTVKPKAKKTMPPTVEEELKLLRAGHHAIAGVDEVGRGCWAGPVVAAAVVLPEGLLADPTPLAGVDDSKALTAPQRQQLARRILELAESWAVGAVPAHVIDT